MKRIMIIILLSSVGGLFLSQCKKEIPIVPPPYRNIYSFINAGDTTGAHHLLLNTTLIADVQSRSLMLDIDSNTLNEIIIRANHWWSNGQTMHSFCSVIELLNHCQIIIDDTLEYITVYRTTMVNGQQYSHDTNHHYTHMKTPLPLDVDTRIDKEGTWKGDSSFYYSYSFSGLTQHVDTTVIETDKFIGWQGLTNKYTGFRILLPYDTLYGWLQLDIISPTTIKVKDIAYR